MMARFRFHRVREIIAGSKAAGLGHGTREMPIWGPVFAKVGPTKKDGELRISNLNL
jgi:hypothetical protein